jgi:hypothetical protein
MVLIDISGLGHVLVMDRFFGHGSFTSGDGFNVSCYACVFTLLLSPGLADLITHRSNPTVGAQYRWTGLYAPRGIMSPAFWSLLQGALITGGQCAHFGW